MAMSVLNFNLVLEMIIILKTVGILENQLFRVKPMKRVGFAPRDVILSDISR